MKNFYPIIGASLLCTYGCNDASDGFVYPAPYVINESVITRSTLVSESLPEGSVIMFHAEGGVNADKLLTYIGGEWKSDDSLYWEIDSTTVYTALYPVYEDKTYSTDNLYANNGLEDVLIANDTLHKKQKIELAFRHLFSQLTIHVKPSIQEILEEIRLTTPITVTGISPESGSITLATDSYTTILPQNETGDYTFILPPMENKQLTLELITSDGNYTKQLPAYTFESNSCYECNIRFPIGIRNAEDLIAFSKLINNKSYTGEKTLEDFGEQVGDETVYYLLADIELTEEECKRLMPIGYNNNYGFNDIFEGNNHTISNLTVPDRSNNSSVYTLYSGLFGYIASTSIVRNLHITNSMSINSPSCSQTGILSAVNYGTIINCSVKNSSITAGESSTALSLICANNDGYIINCFTEGNSIKTGNDCKTGSIAGNATGHILNCYALNNTYTTKSGSYTGGIAGMSNSNVPLTLANCYVYHSKSYTYFGAIVGYLRGATVDYAFYNTGSVYHSITTSTITHAYLYDSSYCVDSIPISTYLNEWIESEGKNNYPDISFRKWKTSEEGSVTFE